MGQNLWGREGGGRGRERGEEEREGVHGVGGVSKVEGRGEWEGEGMGGRERRQRERHRERETEREQEEREQHDAGLVSKYSFGLKADARQCGLLAISKRSLDI